jgi:hypothetical protein
MIDARKFGATVAANAGLILDVFTTEEQALAWLLRIPMLVNDTFRAWLSLGHRETPTAITHLLYLFEADIAHGARNTGPQQIELPARTFAARSLQPVRSPFCLGFLVRIIDFHKTGWVPFCITRKLSKPVGNFFFGSRECTR